MELKVDYMDIQHLEVFVNLAHSLNFSQTAQEMHLSQPGVTKIIHSIENETGLKLFHRNNHHVKLTINGQYFAKKVSYLVNSYERTLNEAQIIQVQEKSTLTLGYTGTPYEIEQIPQIIHQFKNMHPNIQIYIQNFQHNELKDNLLNHRMDAIFTTRDDINLDDSINFFKIGDSKFYAIIPTEFKIFKHKVNITELDSYPLIFMAKNTSGPELINLQHIAMKKCPHSPILYANNIGSLTTMAKSGLGIILLPKYIFLPNTRFQRIALIKNYSVTISYGLVTLKENKNPLLNDLIQSIRTIILPQS